MEFSRLLRLVREYSGTRPSIGEMRIYSVSGAPAASGRRGEAKEVQRTGAGSEQPGEQREDTTKISRENSITFRRFPDP